jgi:secreted trypsin-like serine protease
LFLSTGDSGGGLVLEINSNWTLLGIVSAGLIKHEVCDLTDYVLYTDVSKFYDWIYLMMIESF